MRFEVVVNSGSSSTTWVRWSSFYTEANAHHFARLHGLVGYRVIDHHVQRAVADLRSALLAGAKRRLSP